MDLASQEIVIGLKTIGWFAGGTLQLGLLQQSSGHADRAESGHDLLGNLAIATYDRYPLAEYGALEQIAIDRVHFMDPINLESLLYTYEKSKFSSLTDRRRRFRSNWICSRTRLSGCQLHRVGSHR